MALRIFQNNGVIERKNRCLEEMARTILNESLLPKSFWMDAMNIACYIMNRALIRIILNKTLISSTLEEKQIFLTFISLDVNVMFINMGKTTWINLIPNLMKFGSLDILYLTKPFVYSIKGL